MIATVASTRRGTGGGKEIQMPRMSKAEAPEKVTLEGYEGAFGELGPEYTVGFERYTADADLSPMFKGLLTIAASAPTGDT